MTHFFVTQKGNIRRMRFGELGVTIFGPEQWDDAEWDEFMESGDPETASEQVVTLTLFLRPLDINAHQRKKAAERARSLKRTERMAVLTDSAFTRGIVTAWGWITQKYALKTFMPDQMSLALAWLGESSAEFDRAEAEGAINRVLADVERAQRK